MKNSLFFIFSLILFSISFNAQAHDFYAINSDGDTIYYKITSSVAPYTVAVTFKGNAYNSYTNEYSDTINIPSTVNYNSVVYSVNSISSFAFCQCNGLKYVNIPNSIDSIGAAVFYGCSALTSVTLPNYITTITGGTFQDCNSLTSVIIPNSVTSIGASAFNNCTSLTSINITNSINSIDLFAFYNCRALTSILIPNSVTSIGENAFSYCTGLTSLIIGNSITSIKNEVFCHCLSLTSVIIPNSVDTIFNRAFLDCSNLSSVIIGNSVKSIGDAAFSNCISLNSIIIPNSVNSIGNLAFGNCSGLNSMIIGNSVTLIDDLAFFYCTSLTSISCLATTPPIIYSTSFDGVSNAIPLYVPCGSYSQYQAASYWSNFTNIQGNQPITNNITASICQGETYSLNGFNADTTGAYIQNLQTINGCDSIVTLNLSVNELITPTNLALDNIANYIEITWRGNGENYIVYRDNDSIANITDTIYQDINVIDGTNYCYKIKALNSNCESELSQEECQVFSGLNYIENNNLSVILYPNPTNDKATLEVECLTKDAKVIIYDINGREIKQYNLNAGQKELEIDFNGLAKGVYNVRIVNDNIGLARKLIVR